MSRRQLWGCAVLAVLVFAADQATKSLAGAALADGRFVPLIGRPLGFHLAANKGAAFSLFASGGSTALIGVTVAAIFAILLCARRAANIHPLVMPSFALQLAGAFGNLADRVRFGHVVDFIYVSFWPTFNVADIALTVGVVSLAYCLFTAPAMEAEPSKGT